MIVLIRSAKGIMELFLKNSLLWCVQSFLKGYSNNEKNLFDVLKAMFVTT